MITIPLVNSNLFALVDNKFAFLAKQKWYLWDYKRTCYAQNCKGVKMHTLVLECPPGYVRDHLNGNGLDNRLSNLRVVTNMENLQAKQRYTNNKTGTPGVKFKPKVNRYEAQITTYGIRRYLGSFKTLEEAVAARLAAEGDK